MQRARRPPYLPIYRPVHALCAQGLQPNALLPKAIDRALPNLRQLRLDSCTLIGPAECIVNLACVGLQHVELRGLREPASGSKLLRDTQLLQLAGLPSLSSVSLLDSSCPTLFINALGTQLTALRLDGSYRQLPTWQATQQHAARCTALQSLAIPCATSEELGLVAPALQHLRRLHLNGTGAASMSGDAMVEQLLALPHLTSLTWDDTYDHVLHHSHAGSPCQWRELRLGVGGPHQLARLPLHSLASPVAWHTLVVDQRTSVAEVQAAAHCVAHHSPAGGAWRADGDQPLGLRFLGPGGGAFTRGAGQGDTPAALLRALGPLLAAPGLTQLSVSGLAWDAVLVKVLGEVLPRTCVRLRLRSGSLPENACVQLPRSVPWVQELWLQDVHVVPRSVRLCLNWVAGAQSAQRAVEDRPALRTLRVSNPVRPAGWSVAGLRGAWEEVRQARQGGPGAELVVEL